MLNTYLNSGSVAGNEMDVANNQPLPVGPGMPKIITAADVTVPATANGITLLASPNATASRCIVINTGTATVYLKSTAPADTSTGLPLAPGQSWHFSPNAVPYAICASGTVTVRVVQLG